MTIQYLLRLPPDFWEKKDNITYTLIWMNTCNNYKGYNKQHSSRIQILTVPLFVMEQEGKKKEGKNIKEETKEKKERIRPCADWETVTWDHDAETTFLDANNDCIKEQLDR